MSVFYHRVKNFFPFRSRTNFMLSFLGVAGTGYFFIRYSNDKQFEHSTVLESIRLLTKNTQIVEMIGYPIDIVPGITQNRAQLSENSNVYQFLVRGPRGRLNISLCSEAKTQEQITNSSISKEYYIPDNSLKSTIENVRSKGGEDLLERTVIPAEKKFWKINYLIVDISPDYRIPIVSPPEKNSKKEAEVQKEVNVEKIQKDDEKVRKFLIEVYKEEADRKGNDIKSPKSEEEIEEIRKFKMNETYRKVGYVRSYLFMVAVFGSMGAYIYVIKNKRKRIQGSEIQYIMQQYINSHSYIRNKYGNNLKFIQTSRGSIIDQQAEFEQDFIANKGFGTVFTKGIFNEENKEWKIQSIKVGSKDKKGQLHDLFQLI